MRWLVSWFLVLRNGAAAERLVVDCMPRLRGRRQVSIVYRLYRIGSFYRAEAAWSGLTPPEIQRSFGIHGLKWTALACLQTRNYARAEECMRLYLNERPHARFAIIALTQALLGTGQIGEARSVLESYRAVRPNCREAQRFLAVIERQERMLVSPSPREAILRAQEAIRQERASLQQRVEEPLL